MASGKLAQVLIGGAATNTTIYTVPANMVATLNILVTNNNANAVPVRIAISTQSGTTPLLSEYIEYNASVPAVNGVLERTAIVCSAGEKIIVWAGTGAALTFRINGIEEPA